MDKFVYKKPRLNVRDGSGVIAKDSKDDDMNMINIDEPVRNNT